MNDAPNESPINPSEPAPTGTPPQPASSNKKLLAIVGGVIGLLLVVLIVLVVALLNKNDTNDNNSTTTDSTQRSDSGDATNAERSVVLRAPTSDDKLEYIIYKPEQNASNTTIRFAVRNTCEGCSDTTGIYSVVSSFSNRNNSYLIDDNNGRKYSIITDEDNRPLATPTCNAHLKYDETQECFAAFSKVPSGSTVSWVFGSVRIDGIKVE